MMDATATVWILLLQFMRGSNARVSGKRIHTAEVVRVNFATIEIGR
jgi:hypothetical protein